MGAVAPDSFLSSLPTFSSFAQIADPDIYAALPDDWVLGLADVVDSTRAVAEGRYKSVNVVGASVISAVANALGRRDFPYVFGGDGASYAVPPEWAATARRALAATATLSREEFALDLRIAEVPIAEIRRAGHDVRIARFAASENVAYAMFSGGGLAWAEREMKSGAFALAPAPAGARPDLTGLSCRFDEIRSRRGTILSLIVKPVPESDLVAYRAAIGRVLAAIEESADRARPVPDQGPPPTWPAAGIEMEARANHRPGTSLALTRLKLLAKTVFSYLIIRFRIPVGRFDPNRYIAELVANSDYRKYDDGLRMTVDCPEPLAQEIERILVQGEQAGSLRYGLHRQEAALVTCFSPSIHQADHVHFVDGAMGGYAAAATALKAGPAP